MDNVTHSLTALAMARAGLNRITSRATLLLLISANLPDIDIATAPLGPLRYLEVHRGYTHCLLALPLMAALSVLMTAAIFRRKLSWLSAWIVACLGVASHLLLDWTNGYGIRLLLPFSSRWFHLDVNSLYDVIILAALFLAAVWPSFAGLVHREIGAQVYKGQASSIAVLTFFALFDIGRAVLHQRAADKLDSVLYGGEVPLRVAALPSRLNPFAWNGIVETPEGFRILRVDASSDFADPDASRFFEKMPRDPAITAANATPAFRYFQYFARFPVWTEQPAWIGSQRATRIDLTDLQFGAPNSGSFHCVALVDDAARVLESAFTFGSGRDLGWGEGTPK
jgi:inner membrane protein